MAVKKIAAGSFKVHCLAVMDLFGFLSGKVTIVGDVVSPALKLEEWGNLA